jgi:hypothetical protein
MVKRIRPRSFDNTQAHQEGWELVWGNNRFNVQRVDTNPKFASDDDAGVFVVAQASGGSIYHQRAVDIALGSASPADLELKRKS